MLLSNPYRPDPRVRREAQALIQRGNPVTIIAWDREAVFPEHETVDGVEVVRIRKVRSGYGAGWRQSVRIPLFWREATQLARELAPDIVHCHDLDTLYAGARLKKATGCRLIFDAHEHYPSLMSLYLPGWIIKGLEWWERRLIRQADHTITASTVLAERYRQRGIAASVVGNFQPLAPYERIGEEVIQGFRGELGVKPGEMMVIYIGGFSRNRTLLPLIEAVKGIDNLKLFLWGEGHQKEAVQRAVQAGANHGSPLPYAQYMGWLPAEKVPLVARSADAMVYCLVPDYPGAIYNAPNSLSIAMAAGLPIISNEVGDLGRYIRETGCGILLSFPDAQSIRKAIIALRDGNLRRRLGEAGREAAKVSYNWDVAAENLLAVYDRL